MIPHVNSLDEAQDWFLTHSSGQVMCIRADGAEQIAGSFPEAKAFYGAPSVEQERPEVR